MKDNIPASDFHRAMANELFEKPPTNDEAFCLMLLLHGCRLVLSEQANVEGKVTGFEGITTRHAAEVLASLYQDPDKATPGHWYYKWNGEWRAYSVLEHPTPEIQQGINEMKEKVESHPWVKRVENDDWNVLS